MNSCLVASFACHDMPCLWFLSPGPLKREDGKVAAVDFDGMSVTSPGAEKLP